MGEHQHVFGQSGFVHASAPSLITKRGHNTGAHQAPPLKIQNLVPFADFVSKPGRYVLGAGAGRS